MPHHIVVCIKQTPAVTHIHIDAKTGELRREETTLAINPFDEYAVEEGIRLKERSPGSTTSVLTLGPPEAEEALREALARGCDQAFHVCGPEFVDGDTFATSFALARAVEKISKTLKPVDLVLAGKQTNDSDTGQVGPGIGAWLDWPAAAFVKKVEELGEKSIRVHRMMEDGYDVLELELPAAIACVKEINEPRLPSLKGKMAAKKAVIPRWSAQDLGLESDQVGRKGSPTAVTARATPPSRSGGTRIEGVDAKEKARLLVQKLKELKLI